MQSIYALSFLPHAHLFLQHHLYDPKTFLAVIVLGLLQTVVAADSIYLGLKGLRELPKPAFWGQIGLMVLMGGLIVAVTGGIGYLADRSEKKVDQRSDRAEKALEDLKAGQRSSRSDLDKATYQIQLLRMQTNDNNCSPQDRAVFQAGLKSIEQLVNSARLADQPPIVQPPPVLSNPEAANKELLLKEIENAKERLKELDRDTHEEMIDGVMGGMKAQYSMAWADYARLHPGSPVSLDPQTQQQLDHNFQSARPQIQGYLTQRETQFREILATIVQKRAQALQILTLSNRERASDLAAFNDARKKGLEQVQVPDSWLKAGFLDNLSFYPMEEYLASLHRQLAATK